MVKSNNQSDKKHKSYAVIQISGHGNTPSVKYGDKQADKTLEQGIISFFTEFIINENRNKTNSNQTETDLETQVEKLVKEVLPDKKEKGCTQDSSAYFITAVPHGVSNMMFAGSKESLSSPAEQFRLLYKACDEELHGEVNKNGPITDEIFYKKITSIRQKLRTEHTDLLSLYLKDVINAYNTQVKNQNKNRFFQHLKLPSPFLSDQEKQTEIDEYNKKIKDIESSRHHPSNNTIENISYIFQDVINYLRTPSETEDYYFQTVKDIHQYNKKNGLNLRDEKFKFIENDLHLVDIVFNTKNDFKDKKRLYMCHSFEPELPNLHFNIIKPPKENDAYDFLYGIRMAYLNYDGINNVAASTPTTRSQVYKNADFDLETSFRKNTDFRNYLNDLENEKNHSLKQQVEPYILERIKKGNIFLSDIYILFKWCYGIDKIAFFTPACRNSVTGYTEESHNTETQEQPDYDTIFSFPPVDHSEPLNKKSRIGGKKTRKKTRTRKRTRKQRKLKKRVKK